MPITSPAGTSSSPCEFITRRSPPPPLWGPLPSCPLTPHRPPTHRPARSEHLDGSGELRILLCRPKPAGERGSSILAACGIYMRDILDAVPIDKYFELFKPGEGSEGGFIRISMNYLLPDQVRNPEALLNGTARKSSKSK